MIIGKNLYDISAEIVPTMHIIINVKPSGGLLKTITILVCSISKAKGFIQTRKLAESGSDLTG